MAKELNNDEILKLIDEAKRKAKKKELTKISDKSALSTEDKFKISLCAHFVQYVNENKIKPIDLHKKTGIEKSRISEVLHYKIEKFTIDKLLGYLVVLADHSQKVRIHLRLLEETMGMPLLPQAEAKKLTRTVQKTHRAYM